MMQGPRGGLLLALLGWCLVSGCVPSGSIGPGGEGADFMTSNSSLTGVRFDPSFVSDPRLRLAPSSVHWVLPGEQVLVKWEDLYVKADVGQGPSECHLCAAMAGDTQGMVICDPQPNSYVALITVNELGIITRERSTPFPNDLQVLGYFIWQQGCFTPGASPDQDLGPARPPSFTVNRSAQWAVRIGGEAPTSVAVTVRKPAIAVAPGVGSPVATFWVVPSGSQLGMDPRKLQPLDLNHFRFFVASRDVNGTAWWTDNFAPGLAVGRVRIYKGKIVTDDPFFPGESYLQVRNVIPRRIRVYDPFDPNRTDPFASDVFYCLADPNASTGDGDIDLTRCRSGSGDPTRRLITPAYDPQAPPPQDQPTRVPLTWIVEFDASSGFPPPTLGDGEDLYVEFTLRDAASVR